MNPSNRWDRRWLLPLMLCLLAPGPALAAVKFSHATLGAIDIYTSDSPENTKAFICELLEVRRQVQELVAPVPLPNPRMEVIVFNRLKDYEDFVPAGKVTPADMVTVCGFSSGGYGVTVSVVKQERNSYKFGRQAVLFFYADYLIRSVTTGAPIWLRAGLSEVLAATEYRNGKMFIGGDFMNHQHEVRLDKQIPLERLMNDVEMGDYMGAQAHDNVLFHESWALWQQWLTGPSSRRPQIGTLFAAIRGGEKGDFSTVAQCFAETKEALEGAHRSKRKGGDFPVVESNPDAAALIKGLTFSPATELEGKFALAMLFGRTGKGLGFFGYEFLQLAEAYPDQPRPREALAALATGADDPEGAALKWEQARERDTDNPYAYLLPAVRDLGNQRFYYTLKPQMPESMAVRLRKQLDRCVQLDPACAEAYYYRALLEAFAPSPDKAALEQVERSQTLPVIPLGALYLAIAHWRLGELDEAHGLLAGLLKRPNITADIRQNIGRLNDAMQMAEVRKVQEAAAK